MKKSTIALAIAALSVLSIAQAAPQENTFYVGAKAGWASFHDGIKYHADNTQHGYNRNSVTYGVFGGYQILNRNNFGLAVELGYDDFGRVKFKENGELTDKHTNHGAHLSLKGSYEILQGLDLYARVGAALVRSDYKIYTPSGPFYENSHSLKVSPVFAGGMEYALPLLPELAFRLEYQWINRVGKHDSEGLRLDYQPSIGSVVAGLSYRFGQGAPVVAPEVVSKTFNLNSDVTFAFGKANLKPEAKATLDGIYGEIAQVNGAKVAVAGYTDRIGKDAANLKLSQRRADSVANYLVSKGVGAQDITATGYGEANPVTGAACDAVKGRKALIACLAPDRRVEIAVNGTK
ncbi:porin OmpA [Rodentibacter pneumotropicus]|uniref:Outer membrane protein A n=1 Tax=Rodentibacter pneumotropicus TaxID=758 RepID=A0A4S2PZM7_9PAST|nr:porin OmpA [Rodentibacter pneumotropicus]THA09608.1 porin OmpA [Rodentibacter pneumotropicus]